MDDDLEKTLKLAQQHLARIPVILLGSGASIDLGIPGVSELAQHLQQDPRFDALTSPDDDHWGIVIGALTEDGLGIEAALDRVGFLSPTLRNMIAASIWECLTPSDLTAFTKIRDSRDRPPLTDLYGFLLRTTKSSLVVVTTNYDRLAEYAADVGTLPYSTGFSHGHLKKWTEMRDIQCSRIRIYKVHGSLDWFENANSEVLGLPLASDIPSAHVPLIVPPSQNKYEQTYSNPFHRILSLAEEDIRKASAFLCIGYGFNDHHIQESILNYCVEANVPIMIMSLDASNGRRILMERKVRHWIIFESAEGTSHTRVSTQDDPTGWIIHDRTLWKLGSLLPYVMGGSES